MSDIFLSYAREDRERVKLLVDWLEQQGWSVWWDRHIPPGKTYDQVIEGALEGARCVLVIWSNDSVASEWVRSEAEEGLNRRVLVPVLMDNVRPPLGFRRTQAANLSDWSGDPKHPELVSLFQAIREMLGNTSAGSAEIRPPVQQNIAPSAKKYPVNWQIAALIVVAAIAIGLTALLISWSSHPDDPITNLNTNTNANAHSGNLNSNSAPPSVTATPTPHFEVTDNTAVEIFNNRNIYAVDNEPPQPTQFTIDKPYFVNYVTSYHWNNGQGKDPTGMHLKFRDQKGTELGHCELSSTSSAAGGPPNVNWICSPNVWLQPGTYTVIDPDIRTWSYNRQSGNAGMILIRALPGILR